MAGVDGDGGTLTENTFLLHLTRLRFRFIARTILWEEIACQIIRRVSIGEEQMRKMPKHMCMRTEIPLLRVIPRPASPRFSPAL
jgi:hypothetical protein